MVRTAQRYWVCLLVCALAVSVAIWPYVTQRAVANTPAAVDQQLSLITYNPPNRGAPGRTADGGSRRCAELVALQPGRTHWGETTDAHPTFWISVSGAADSLTLTLADEYSKESFYQTAFAPTATPGIGRYTLPYGAPALAVDTPYRWTVSLTCPMTDSQPEVSGVIVRRVMSAMLQADLSEAAPRDRIVLLAADGLWYNALNELAELRLANVDDETLAADWATLLQHTQSEDGAEQIMDKPLLEEYPNRL